MPNKTTLLILGNSHDDFVPYPVLTELFETLHRNKIPCAWMEEGPCDQDLNTTYQLTKSAIKTAQLIKSHVPKLVELYKMDKNTSSLYLPRTIQHSVTQLFRTEVVPFFGLDPNDETLLSQGILDFYRENAYIAQLKLYDKLRARMIPFMGLEAPSSMYTQQINSCHASPKEYVQYELSRSERMVSNIVKKLLDFPQGGVIVVFVGNNHAHRLAANLQLKLLCGKNKDELLALNLELHAFKLTSRFVIEQEEVVAYASKATASLDSSDIKAIYQSLPCPYISANDTTGLVCYPELEPLFHSITKKEDPLKLKLAANAQSLFSLSLTPHDQLVMKVKDYLANHPEKSKPLFMKALEEEKNYSFALRCACCYGYIVLVKILVNYSPILSIDFNQRSTNGKTALDWFEASTASADEKIEIRTLLEEHMQPKAAERSMCLTQ